MTDYKGSQSQQGSKQPSQQQPSSNKTQSGSANKVGEQNRPGMRDENR